MSRGNRTAASFKCSVPGDVVYSCGSLGEVLGLGSGLPAPLNLRQSIIVVFLGFVLSNLLLVVTVATLDEIQIFKGIYSF